VTSVKAYPPSHKATAGKKQKFYCAVENKGGTTGTPVLCYKYFVAGDGSFYMKKLWQTNWELDKKVEAFETKEDLAMDQKLLKYDLLGTKAHAKSLFLMGIYGKKELRQVLDCLNSLTILVEQGKFHLKMGDEDMHTAIEAHLTEKLGLAGEKIHTARSRNDQVATATRLYIKENLEEIIKKVKAAMRLIDQSGDKYSKLFMPGFTHTRKAMPYTFGAWLHSFSESFQDDVIQMKAALKITDKSALGTGAGYGLPLDYPRSAAASDIGFSAIIENALYCQNSRGKSEAVVVSSLISLALTINKFVSDLLFFSSDTLGFIEIDKSLTSGSSIMPHKKNLDIAELLRSKVHRLTANYINITGLAANLMSGYHRDFQEIKRPLIDSIEQTLESLEMMLILVKNLKPVKEKLEQADTPELHAAEEAYKLVKKGHSFRQAYRRIAARYRQR